MITLEDVVNNEEVQALVQGAQKQLNSLGYTEHSARHVGIVSKRAGDILETLGYPKERVELAKIARLFTRYRKLYKQKRPRAFRSITCLQYSKRCAV